MFLQATAVSEFMTLEEFYDQRDEQTSFVRSGKPAPGGSARSWCRPTGRGGDSAKPRSEA